MRRRCERMGKKAVIFDLDGVIVSTDEYHYLGWKRMADEEGIPFNSEINEKLRGVSRMASLGIILERTERSYSRQEREALAERKNNYYRELLNNLTPKDILPGVMQILNELKKRRIKIAIGSSSKNTPVILEKIGLDHFFDAVADGNEIKKSKPDPEVFLLAASKLGITAEECVVVEDAEAGIEAAKAGGMKAVGVGSASACPMADLRMQDLSGAIVDEILMD